MLHDQEQKMDFLRNLYDNYEKQLFDTGLDDLKAATKNHL